MGQRAVSDLCLLSLVRADKSRGPPQIALREQSGASRYVPGTHSEADFDMVAFCRITARCLYGHRLAKSMSFRTAGAQKCAADGTQTGSSCVLL